MNLEQLYQQVILDHAKQRTGQVSPLEEQTGPGVASSHQVNPTCGDEITLEVSVEPGGMRVRWDGAGCSISMASASVLTEMAEDHTPEEFAAVEAAFYDMLHSRGQGEPDEDLLEDASAFAGVSKFPARVKCALLAWMAYKAAVAEVTARERETQS